MYDVVGVGEVLLRLSIPVPQRIETTRSLDVQIGGAEANVVAACARLGLRAALISAWPDNAWGDRIRRDLHGHGVDCRHAMALPATRIGTYFLEYGAAPRPIRVLYDRKDSAFSQLTVEMVDWNCVREARLVHVSGVTAALGGNPRALVRRVLDEAQSVSFDVNYRAALWSTTEAKTFLYEVLPRVRYLFVGSVEAAALFEHRSSPAKTLEVLAKLAPHATINVMQGAEGATMLRDGKVWTPDVLHTVNLVDPVGAGDAYVAGFIWAELSGRTSQEVINAACTVGALKCATWGDIALVTEQEVNDALSGGPDVRR